MRFFLYMYIYECDKVLSQYVGATFKHVPFSGQFCLDVAGCVCGGTLFGGTHAASSAFGSKSSAGRLSSWKW